MLAFATPGAPTRFPQTSTHSFRQTPSPLRTSLNANLMPPHSPPSSPIAIDDPKSFPFVTPSKSSHRSSSVLTPPSTQRRTFASRSRASTPQATISAQNAAAKDRRKTLFRDKIRKQRDDVRFESRGDQVLRMDFVTERKEWEQRLARSAPVEIGLADLGDHGSGEEITRADQQHSHTAMSEEEERQEEAGIDALAQYLVDREVEVSPAPNHAIQTVDAPSQLHRLNDPSRPRYRETTTSEWCEDISTYGSDADDYDQLFMDMISSSNEQQWDGNHHLELEPVPIRQRCLTGAGPGRGHNHTCNPIHGVQDQDLSGSSLMDLS